MYVTGQIFALKIIRESDAVLAKCSELGAALGDDLIFVLLRVGWFGSHDVWVSYDQEFRSAFTGAGLCHKCRITRNLTATLVGVEVS
jgi:hypothetical protein